MHINAYFSICLFAFYLIGSHFFCCCFGTSLNIFFDVFLEKALMTFLFEGMASCVLLTKWRENKTGNAKVYG